MIKSRQKKIMKRSYIDMGLYSISDGARLLKIPEQKLRRWIVGDPHGSSVPLITNEIARIDGQISLSFINLIEALFISKFVAYGLHARSIRMMAEEAASFLNTPHPFATNVLFKTDGKKIFAFVEKQTDDPKLYDLKKHNWALEPILGRELEHAVGYKASGIAQRWYPKKETYRHVVLNPTAAFGQPVLDDSAVPTRVIYSAYLAEDKNNEIVSKWFNIPVARVKEAVKFEKALAA